MTWYTFGGSGIAYCNGNYYSDSQHVVAMSDNFMGSDRSNCGRQVKIQTSSGNTITATLVDKCAQSDGCADSTVDALPGVWNALGLNMDDGVSSITWSWA